MTDLGALFADLARGRFPAPDGTTTVWPLAGEREAGVLALTARSFVFADADEGSVRERLARTGSDPLAASLHPSFLAALLERTGRRMDTVDLLTVAPALPGPPPLELRESAPHGHPRVARALRRRTEVRVWETAEGDVVLLGRGPGGRWETAIETAGAGVRGRGRALALAARHLVPGAAVWAQQAPGNARSVRAFQAAGYRAVGAEALLWRAPE
ncbi:GNAT family N-acetyltransferase [Streptomyces sp. NEAU-H3]|uniref:GNAT family N-acetyltransferase n=1 Tax=Streptomyces sp. NEAU-H3 TaxID=2720636 RepID=UPI00280AEAAB|nr:GNAT family N-acetyltransferase [Streptomyces sp. NEAU-H3]